MVKINFCLAAAFFLLAAAAPGRVAGAATRPMTEMELEQAVSLEFETPHTAWAKPWAGGTVRALFFARYTEGGGFGRAETREIVELAQRFDLAPDAAYYHMRNSRWLGEQGGPGFWARRHYDERWAALAETDYDVYVFLGLEPELLPEAMLERVRAAVAEGAGALLVGAAGEGLVSGEETVERPGAGLPEGAYRRAGAGRLALLPEREPIAYRPGWETVYDHLSQARGRALLWAAGRAPGMTLSLEIGDDRPRAQEPSAVRLAWGGAPAGTVIEPRLRRTDGWGMALETLAAGGGGEALLPLPPVRAGDYYLDVIARGPSGVENWAAVPWTVTSPVRNLLLELDRDWADPETEKDPVISGRAFVAAPSVLLAREIAPGHGVVRVRLRDPRGRVLVRHDLPPGETEFRLPVDRWLPMLLWAEAVLLTGGQEEIASEPLPFRVTSRRRGEFNFVMWGAPGGELGPWAMEKLAREGITVILEYGGTPHLSMAANGIAFMPYATWLASDFSTLPGSLDLEGEIRNTGCYNARDSFANHVAWVVAGQSESRRHGTFAYSLGDENAVRASCLHPACLEAYRDYLGLKYGGEIAALNESWGSDYGSFAEIALLEPGEIPAPDAPEWFREWYKERVAFIRSRYPARHRPAEFPMDEAAIRLGDVNDELGALQAGNFARWYDRQAFQTWNLVQAAKRFGEEFRELDPLALTGFEGTNSFAIPRNPTRIRQGGDIDLMAREFGWWGPYRDASNEVIRSLAGPGYPRGNWFGYFRDADREARNYWGMVNDHLTQVQWWRWSGVGRYHGLLAPHLAPYSSRREMLDRTAVIRDGLGTLLMHARMLEDGVLLYYSLPSTYIGHFDGNESYGSFARSQAAWRDRVRNAGLQFRYVTDRQLRLGEFDPGAARVLVLPFIPALGDDEAALIRSFVAGGGTLVADVRPGTYTGRCRPREDGVLDDVFGIRRSGKAPAREAAVEVPGLMSWAEGRADPAVEATTGAARGTAGDMPAFIVNEYGAGRAILLNFPLEGAPADELVAALLAEAGVRAPVALRRLRAAAADGEAAPEAVPDADIDAQLEAVPLEEAPHIRRWRSGGIEFLSVTAGREMEIVLTLPEARHVYDITGRRALGPTGEITAAVTPGQPGFFALLPAEAPGPVIFAERRLNIARAEFALERGARLEAALAVPGAAGPHALRLRVFDPEGREAEWFGRVIIAGDSPETLDLPFAHDDPPGAWLLRATDLYSGQSAELRINLR